MGGGLSKGEPQFLAGQSGEKSCVLGREVNKKRSKFTYLV